MKEIQYGHPHPPHSVTSSEERSSLEKACGYHSTVFFRKERQLIELGRAQTGFSYTNRALCYQCALKKEYSYLLGMRTLPQIKMASFIKAVGARTIDRIGRGRSDARRKLRHRGPARYKMERIYV